MAAARPELVVTMWMARPSTQRMQVDQVAIDKSYYNALWDEDEYSEMPEMMDEAFRCAPCGTPFFQRP